MKKLYSAIFFFCIAALSGVFAANVELTMNSTIPAISLKEKGTETPVSVGEMSSTYVYSFQAGAGTYILEAFSNDMSKSYGTIELVIDEKKADQSFVVKTVTVGASNSGWVLGTDYTVDSKILTNTGESRKNTWSTSAVSGKQVTLAFTGDAHYTKLIPNETNKAEGYIDFELSAQILTANVTVNGAIAKGVAYTVSIPKNAELSFTRNLLAYQKDVDVTPTSVSDNGETKNYTFTLIANQKYRYRVKEAGKVTRVNVVTATAGGSLAITDAMMEGDPKKIDHDVKSNSGYNVADVLMNINPEGHLQLKTGENYQLRNFRIWQAVDGILNNFIIEPDFNYSVVDLEGKPSSNIVSVNEKGELQALGKGTAIVLVTYDAMNYDPTSSMGGGGPFFGAVWPENTGVFVVSVDEAEAGIKTNIEINQSLNDLDLPNKVAQWGVDAELDVFYYVAGTGGYYYTFTPEGAVTSVTLAQPTLSETALSFTGFKEDGAVNNGDGSYTVCLKHGRNIVKISSASGSEYQVLTAKSLNYTIKNLTNPDKNILPGDQISVIFDKAYNPGNKMGGIFNQRANIRYEVSGREITSTANQYAFASTEAAQTIKYTIDEDWDITQPLKITKGGIFSTGAAHLYGAHRGISYYTGASEYKTGSTKTGTYFGALPDIILYMGTPVESVKLDVNSLDLLAGKTHQLTANVYPEEVIVKDVIWASSNNEIATVNENGLVTAIGAGSVNIIATTKNGGLSDTCSIKVTIPVSGIELDKTEAKLSVEETLQLTATVAPDNATNKNISWESSDIKIATVDENGLVTAVAAGSATITVKTEDGKLEAKCQITVTVPVSAISLDKTEAKLIVEETLQLRATIAPNNATNKNIKWETSDDEIATVDENGLVTAIAIGSATIIVKTEDGGLEASCEITVEKKGSSIDEQTANSNIYKDSLTGNIIVRSSVDGALTVTHISGENVLSMNINTGETTIDTSFLSQGVYIIKLGDTTLKFIK